MMVVMLQLLKGLFLNFLFFFFLASLFNQVQFNKTIFNSFAQNVLTGIIFGAIACLGMAMGIELQPGLKIDGRIILVGVASAYGGPLSGVIAAIIVCAFRAFLGGLGVYVGIAGIIGACLTGILFYYKISTKPIPYNGIALGLLGLALTLQAQLWAPLLLPIDIALNLLKKIFLIGILFYPFSMVIIGLLLNNGIKRQKLQTDLAESYQQIEETVKTRTIELEESNGRLRSTIDEKAKIESDLRKALEDIKTLSGILPICAHCKVIRDDNGSWIQMEEYIQSRSEAEFSHSVCDNCLEKYYPEEK